MNKTTVIHHSADFDGIFCREIARKFLPEAELIGWDYGQPRIPIPEGTTYVLDLSPDCLEDGELGNFVIWIDHHKSAIEKFGPTLPGYRIDGVAACRLAWQWFTHRVQQDTETGKGMTVVPLPLKAAYVERTVFEPWAVKLAGEYDIWDKRDSDAELFQHGLRSEELYPLIWNGLLSAHGDTIVCRLLNQGRALQYARTNENASIIKEIGFTIHFEGLTFLACNAARYNSFLFTAGLTPEHDGCFGFKWTGKDWSVSLYHAPGKEHHDLSVIAVKYGGGGHRGACGFRMGRDELLPVIGNTL